MEGLFPRKTSGLVKEIDRKDALSLGLTFLGPVGGTIFPLSISFTTPEGSWTLGVLVGVLLGIPLALMYSRLMGRIPRSGGDYIYVSRFLSPTAGITLAIANLLVLGSVVPVFGGLEYYMVVQPFVQNLNLPLGVYPFLTLFVMTSIILSMLPVKWMGRMLLAISLFQIIGLGAIVLLLSQGAISPHPGGSTSLPQTLILGAVGFIFVYAFNSGSVWFAGEVRKNALKYSVVYPYVLSGVLSLITALMFSRLVGREEYLLAVQSNPNISSVFQLALNGNLLLMSISVASALTWFQVYSIVGLSIGSRILFSMSFDRVLPSFLIKVKGGVPIVSSLLMAVMASVSTLLYGQGFSVTPMVEVIGYVVYGFLVVSLSGITASRKLGDRPLGVYSVASLSSILFSLLAITYYSIYGPQTGFLQVVLGNVAVSIPFLVAVPLVSLLITWVSRKYRKSQGIDLSAVFREIPPD